MTLWFVFSLMTAAAVFAVLWPLGRRRAAVEGGSETAVYKDQLAEIGADTQSGLIGPPEAEAARIEISRRLLAAAASEQIATLRVDRTSRRAVSLVALIGMPLIAIMLYLQVGSPFIPDFPLAERTTSQPATASLDRLVAQVEKVLETNPTDGRGWSLLAPVLMKVGRYDDAAKAFRNAITYAGETADKRSGLGEAIAASANGVVTSDAKAAFDRALALDPSDVTATYFSGVAAEQEGRTSAAANIWRGMLAQAPRDAPWRSLVQASLTRVSGTPAPQISDNDVSAAQGMSDADRSTMIHGMVDRLASRLKDNSDDVQGWLRLVRAYMVLGETEKVNAARGEALQALAGKTDKLREFNAGLKELGLNGSNG